VKKVVIVTGKSEPDYHLFALVNAIFPECEVRFVSREIDFGDGPEKNFSEPLTASINSSG
jgi:hypothetical protein